MSKNIKKIAMITTSTLPIPSIKGGGVEVIITDLLKEFCGNENFTMDVFNNCKKVNYNEKSFSKNLNFIFVNSTIIDKVKNLFRKIYKKILKNFFNREIYIKTSFIDKLFKKYDLDKYDCLLIEGSPHQVLQIRKKYNKKIILHIHTTMQFTKSIPFAKDILNSCDYVLANSEFVKFKISEIDKSQNNKILILKNCINTKNFGSSSFDNFKNEFRKTIGLKPEEKLLLYSGRIVEEKGIRELLLALKNTSNCKLLILGGNFVSSKKTKKYVKEIKKICNSLNEKVIFLGFINHDELPKYIYSCDISIVPSLCEEAAGLVALEAQASGLPVIYTNMGGLPEYVSNDSGIMVKNDDDLISNLTNAINKLVKNENEYKIKKNNTKKNVEKFDISYYYKNFLKIWEMIK